MNKAIKVLIFLFLIFLLLFYFFQNSNNEKFKVNFETKGFKLLQSRDKSISIIDVDLSYNNFSLGGVKNSDKGLFYREYANDFLKSYSGAVAVINSQFFLDVNSKNSGLSFPVKSNFELLSDFNDNNNLSKKTLILTKDDNLIIKKSYDKKDFLNDNYKELIVSYDPSVNIDGKKYFDLGRTYVGIKGDKNIIFFIGESVNQIKMLGIIKNYGIKQENVIVFDGGPSSQFATKFENKNYYGKWGVPHFSVIYKK